MTCANCIALRDRVAELERQVGQTFPKGAMGAVAQAFGLSAHQSRLILTLYYNADWVDRHRLGRDLDIDAETIPSRVWQIRNRMGDSDVIESHWGLGYRVSRPFRDRLKEALG